MAMMAGDGCERKGYSACANWAFRLLTAALVTKTAKILMAVSQFRLAASQTGETMDLAALATGTNLITLIASADGLVWLLAQIFFGLWLFQAAKEGLVSWGKDGYPRRLGHVFLAGVIASVLADLFAFGVLLVEIIPVISRIDVGSVVPMIPRELPVVYFKMNAVRLGCVSILQMELIVVVLLLIDGASREPSLSDTHHAPSPSDVGDSPSSSGLGWPEQPVR